MAVSCKLQPRSIIFAWNRRFGIIRTLLQVTAYCHPLFQLQVFLFMLPISMKLGEHRTPRALPGDFYPRSRAGDAYAHPANYVRLPFEQVREHKQKQPPLDVERREKDKQKQTAYRGKGMALGDIAFLGRGECSILGNKISQLRRSKVPKIRRECKVLAPAPTP